MLVRRIVERDRINIPACCCRRNAQSKQSMDNVIQVLHTHKKNAPPRSMPRTEPGKGLGMFGNPGDALPTERTSRLKAAQNHHCARTCRAPNATHRQPLPPAYCGGVSCALKIPVIIFKCNKSRKINANMNDCMLMIELPLRNPKITSCIC